MVTQFRVGESTQGETDDLSSPGSAPPTQSQTYGASTRSGESQFIRDEVEGDRVVPTSGDPRESSGDAYSEFGSPAASEAAEEVVEATPARLAEPESDGESAITDLASVPGFEGPRTAQEAAALSESPLPEAGTAIAPGQETGQEEFGFLAALVPTLVSTVGPAIAKGVISRLSPKAQRAIPRLAGSVTRVATTATGLAGAATAAATAAASAPRPGGTGSLLALLAQLLNSQAAKATGEAVSIEADPLVEEAARVLEVIIGNDDRLRIQRTTDVPWRRYCALRITFPKGVFRGTGFFIGARAVATAGHCVYMHDQGGWARSIEVIPGSSGTERPFGQAAATTFRSVAGWVTSRNPETDFGCIVLPMGAFGGRNLGSFGFAAWDAQELVAHSAVLAGYPGDKPFAEMWGMAQRIQTVTANTLRYQIDTYGGQSGTAVYIKRNDQRYVVGIHNYGAAGGNSATRVTRPVYERLLAWSQL
jgi:V8-like Glu-specific endopeptidase